MLTTVIGAYPKPNYLKITDWFNVKGGTDTENPTKYYFVKLRGNAPGFPWAKPLVCGKIGYEERRLTPLKRITFFRFVLQRYVFLL